MLSQILHRQKREKWSVIPLFCRLVFCSCNSQNSQVSIGRKDFDLTTANGAVAFLREMYNLVAMLEEVAKHLDQSKQNSLVKVNQDASKMISLTYI